MASTLWSLYWLENGRNHEQDFASRTEAEIQRLILKRQGITARLVRIVTQTGD